MNDRPIFTVRQPSRRQARLDLSAPGWFGDFAFEVTDLTTGRAKTFDAYHTGEASIFLDVLHTMIAKRSPSEVLEDITRIRADIEDRASDKIATTESQNNFDYILTPWLATLTTPPAPSSYRASTDRRHTLALAPTDDALTFNIRNGAAARPRDPKIVIPAGRLWQFAAGMIWRSYSPDSRAPLLTRTSTAAYNTALDALQAALDERNHVTD